ncbi:venom carboxylesterase-6-like [Diabrotica virgifera virgifera]|uniref:Carboxylic ester hydrolase n=1 Tax=Diabrotica virgifera virgifera TaxID=50390 RepID=A0ABM5KXR1_DIAVI|nr:venom carboxylesterase-6-like [Diabrotica virgifera virgifera]
MEGHNRRGKDLSRVMIPKEENEGPRPPKEWKWKTPPLPKASWTNTLDCTYDRSVCVQTQGITNPTVIGSEDCLYLSVYSPDIKGVDLPVLFWIHGGAFVAGSNSFDACKPDHFINQNVVVVMIQYRLGVFGFMSTGDSACPGNLGLKDQVMALDWTIRNIRHFGGNPKDITIGGLSAGGGSVGYHLLSPKSAVDKIGEAGKFGPNTVSCSIPNLLNNLMLPDSFILTNQIYLIHFILDAFKMILPIFISYVPWTTLLKDSSFDYMKSTLS